MNVSVEGYMRKEETEEKVRLEREGARATRFSRLVQGSLLGEYI